MSFHQTKLRALDYIRSHTLAKGESPTMREIAYGIGQASPGSVHRLVAVLEAEGKIRRIPGKQRSIEVVPATGVIAVELPPELYVQVEAVARKANVSLAQAGDRGRARWVQAFAADDPRSGVPEAFT